jgi:hypothetical protein
VKARPAPVPHHNHDAVSSELVFFDVIGVMFTMARDTAKVGCASSRAAEVEWYDNGELLGMIALVLRLT